MENTDNILGCFISFHEEKEVPIFKPYIWGEKGICDTLKTLKKDLYGQDIKLILFQFYVNPIPYLLDNLKEIENYRRKEKSIGIPIVINEDNFFNKTEEDRYKFLKEIIPQKIDLLIDVVKRNKLDTNLQLLKSDVEKLLNEINH